MHVTVVDYGCGNLLSVIRALEHVGAAPKLCHDATGIDASDRIILPGVGAFAAGMQGLRERGLIEPIRRYAASGRPLLGICLGMQMLASFSEEFGKHEGLGLVPGRVIPVPAYDVAGLRQKIPHIGWADVFQAEPCCWNGTMFRDTNEGTPFYLVHSFHFEPAGQTSRLADCYYGGHRLAAAVRSDRIIGCQFHPEKSGKAGLALLRAFLHS